jgi:hypothetical protein
MAEPRGPFPHGPGIHRQGAPAPEWYPASSPAWKPALGSLQEAPSGPEMGWNGKDCSLATGARPRPGRDASQGESPLEAPLEPRGVRSPDRVVPSRRAAARERIVSGGRGPVGSGSPQAVGGLTKSGSPDLPRDTAQRRIATLRAAKEMASPGSGPAPGTSCRRSAGPVSRFPTSHAERDSGPGRGRRGHVPRGVSGRFPTELRGSASPANQGEPHGGFSPQPPKRKKGRPA